MMNWSWIVLGLVALSSVTFAANSYLVIVPNLLKVGHDNQVSVFIAASREPVEVKFDLTIGDKHLQTKIMCKPGETRNATLTLPKEFPVGAGELIIVGTGGLSFEEKRDIIIYDNRHVILVQTSSSTYRPRDTMEIRVVVTDESFMPMESGELTVEVYDAALKLVGEYPRVPVRYGLTETLRFPFSEHISMGTWLVSATVGNTTSSVQVFVTRPVTFSFDLKAIFPRFLLRTDKILRGVVEIDNDESKPIFGRGIVAIGPVTEQEILSKMQKKPKEEDMKNDEWRQWKSKEIDIAGRLELNYDLLSLFNIDISKAVAIQVYIQVTDAASKHERVIRHLIPIFSRDIIYDIRPLEFESGVTNEYEIIAKRPDGKPTKMENMIVTVRMIMNDDKEEKIVEIKDFYTRGRNDIGFFNLEIPEQCIGVLMMITPLDESGKVHGYRTPPVPLMPTPRRHGAKLSIELLPSTVAPANTNVNVPVISSQISTVGRTSNFYIQLLPSKSVEKFERLPMSYVLMTNGRITLTGEFYIEPTKECQTKTVRTIHPEKPMPPTCVFNGTLPIQITRDMMPYSTLLVYTFQPTFGFNVAETYRFSVAGLFQNSLSLNATIVPYTPTETVIDNFPYMKEMNMKPIHISNKVQDKTRVELSFTGVPDSTVGLNVFEYDGILQGLSNEITKERLLQHLTTYERVPIEHMPTMPLDSRRVMKTRDLDVKIGKRQTTDDKDTVLNVRDADIKIGKRQTTGDKDTVLDVRDADIKIGKRQTTDDDMDKDKDLDERDNQYDPKSGGKRTIDNEKMPKPTKTKSEETGKYSERTFSEQDEENQMNRERMGYKVRYPIEKMIFGVSSTHNLPLVEGDDIYTTSNMGRFYGDVQNSYSSSSHYRRKLEKSISQYDVTVDNNDYVVATSMPHPFPMESSSSKFMPVKNSKESTDDFYMMKEHQPPMYEKTSRYGTPLWYEQMHKRLNDFSQEAFTFMQSGLSIITDFDSLHVPVEMKYENFTKLFSKFRQQSMLYKPFLSVRDEARQLLEEYISQSDLSLVPPAIMFEEEARTTYYRSMYFNTSRIESKGTGKIVLPRMKPSSTWIASGFSLNMKSGLSIAQPIRLPSNRGLFIIGDCPKQVKMGEHVTLPYSIHNYLEKDVTNVMFRLLTSKDFDLYENKEMKKISSFYEKDYTREIPSMKSYAVETGSLVFVPKRSGLIQIVMEVESEFGGDYEVFTLYVHEASIEHKELNGHYFDLTTDKKRYGPFVEKFTDSPNLRSVQFSVSGSGVDQITKFYELATNSLVGIDRAIIRLYRALGLRRYLNETCQTDSPLFNMTMDNITTSYQTLQFYNEYDGSYSFISDEGTRYSSLYLTSLAFGAMISPMMPFRDNVTLNRTLTWILSHQNEDGSFDHDGPCFHYRYCASEFRRESLTALVLYSLTRHNSSEYMPEFIYHRLYNGENSPLRRAQHYLESRVSTVKPHFLTITLFEMAFIQSRTLSPELREKIRETLYSRKLTVVPEDGSKYLKKPDESMTFDDQLLLNSMTLSLYTYYGDYRTTSDMARWIFSQVKTHPYYDTILDAVFRTDAWMNFACLFRKEFDEEKLDITVDVTADNGEKHQFKINSTNFDMTQTCYFKLPVRQMTYSIQGFGIVLVRWVEKFVEDKYSYDPKTLPFKLTHEFKQQSKPEEEIHAKTCMTYTPTMKDLKYVKEDFNRTMVLEFKLPTGAYIDVRQMAFMFSRMEHVIYFTYEPCGNKLVIFVNVPSTSFGKSLCLDWCFEYFSMALTWAPVQVRVYDYLQQETQFIQLFPIKTPTSSLSYTPINMIH